MFKVTLEKVREKMDSALAAIADVNMHKIIDKMVEEVAAGKPYCYWTGIVAGDDIKMLRRAGYKVRIIAGEWTQGYFDGMIKIRWQKSRRVW